MSPISAHLRSKQCLFIAVFLCIHTFDLLCLEYELLKFSDHIVAQQANRYIVAFHIAISRYGTIRSGLLITGGL